MEERWVLHCDCNSFYASVELLAHPELRQKCVAVCGDPESRHGIILAKNEPAKKLGVKTAETIWQAKRKCPDLVLLPPHRELYRKYYRIINTIYQRYTDRVEPFSIDESWLDVTGSWQLFAQSPGDLADRLRAQVREATGLTVSVGVDVYKRQDVDVALTVGLGLLGGEQVGRVVGLGAGGADLQHAAHGGVAVDVGVVALHVADTGVHIGCLLYTST